MEPTRELADAIWREKVRRAKAMTPDERLREACRLSDFVFDMMRAGVRSRNPAADDAEVDRIVKDQLDRIRRVEERGIYHPIEEGTEAS